MAPEEIRALMALKKVKQTHIANATGVKSQTIYKVIEGILKSPRLRQALAKAVGKPVSELWAA